MFPEKKLHILAFTAVWAQRARCLLACIGRYSYHTEDNVHSEGYPGLKTLYCVHQASQSIPRMFPNAVVWKDLDGRHAGHISGDEPGSLQGHRISSAVTLHCGGANLCSSIAVL